MEKNTKSIICPICNNTIFVTKQFNGEKQCSHCGWIYDVNQLENPDFKFGLNRLRVNEYKKWFERKINKYPNYDFLKDHQPPLEPHICPVCKEYKFKDTLSFAICNVCGWEDTGLENEPDKKLNDETMSFNETLAWFKKQRANNPNYKWIEDVEDDE